MSAIQNYLQNGLVVDIFYLKDRDMLKTHLLEYLEYGTTSLARNPRYLGKNRMYSCEYRIYKILTFLDCIRESKYFTMFLSMMYMKGYPLLDYLLDYVLSRCTLECIRYEGIDFSTHYLNRKIESYGDYSEIRKCNGGGHFYLPKVNNLLFKSNEYTSSMLLLDFNKVYRVICIKEIATKYGKSYIITLFDYVEHMNHPMLCDFWLPKSCLSEIKGTKFVSKNGYLNIWQNQFIRIVDIKEYMSKKYVAIKSYAPKSIIQLRKTKS